MKCIEHKTKIYLTKLLTLTKDKFCHSIAVLYSFLSLFWRTQMDRKRGSIRFSKVGNIPFTFKCHSDINNYFYKGNCYKRYFRSNKLYARNGSTIRELYELKDKGYLEEERIGWNRGEYAKFYLYIIFALFVT